MAFYIAVVKYELAKPFVYEKNSQVRRSAAKFYKSLLLIKLASGGGLWADILPFFVYMLPKVSRQSNRR
ncbi:hypothetical protein CVV43_02415 [Candidatus Saccharibacteria bacterium HGW-Saccharibacteria-1]|nr:MAG: hypothetical protein CVV43_02415 [Candidatus Saccharibacteria bacterium HGW-Saccharibacteria-1]